MKLEDIAFFVMAGGRSSRMGEDKALLLLDGQSIMQRILKLLKSIHSDIGIIGHSEDYQTFGYPVIPDIIPGQGLMGGLYTAMKSTTKTYVFIIACDLPLINVDCILRILKSEANCDIILAASDSKIHPSLGCYHRRLLPRVQESIEKAQLKMKDFIYTCDYTTVEMDDLMENNPNLLFNLNTKEDYQKLLEAWNKRSFN